jgi:hypothetical protein
MRRIVLAGLLCGVVMMATGAPAMAQDRAMAEIFAGGSFARISGSNFGGWNTAVTGNLNSWLGITADFAGHYNSPLSLYTYTVGPRLSIPQDSGLVPFTQATFGGARLGVSGPLGGHANGFGAYLGGGLDWIPNQRIAVRLMEIDALLTRISGSNTNGTRISFGVVFRLGRR